MLPAYTIYPLGDSALTIDFGNKIDEELNGYVLQLFRTLLNSSPVVKDVIPAYSSLSIYYDVAEQHSNERTAFETMKEIILPFLYNNHELNVKGRLIKIPVCYSSKFSLDLEELAAQKNFPVEEIIRLHTEKTYRVYMIGFLPGFAYMGTVDKRIATPRKQQPRTSVPAGSIGIAGEQTGIYPLPSPGGWNIIGRTPVKVFAAEKEDAVLFQPGDEVKFYSITEDEFENYQGGNS